MYAVKQSTSTRLPVALRNVSTGLPLLGVLYSAVTATVLKADGTLVTLTLSSSADWAEVTTGAFNGTGTYELVVPTSASGVVGRLVVAVAVSGALDVPVAVIDVVASLASDIQTVVDAIKAKTDNLPSDPADESLLEAAITAATSPLATAVNLATVDTVVDAIKLKTDNLPSDPGDQSVLAGLIGAVQTAVDAGASDSEISRKVLTGDYFLDSATNTLTIYDEDGVTPLYVFDTTKNEVPSITGVTRRVAQ